MQEVQPSLPHKSYLSVMVGSVSVLPLSRCFGSMEGIANCFSVGDVLLWMLGGTESSILSSSLSRRDLSTICETMTSLPLTTGIGPMSTSTDLLI